MKKLKGLLLCMACIIGLAACSSSATNKSESYATSSGAKDNTGGNQSAAQDSSPMEPSAMDMEAPEYGIPQSDTSMQAVDGGGESDAFVAEEYLEIIENKEVQTSENPLLTFSLKIDSASYRNVLRYIESGNLPPHDAIRTEEMINYFRYEQPLEENDTPFSVYTEIGPSPFNEDKHLAFVRVKAKDIDKENLPHSNLTFLIDSSGSMSSYDKLPLLQSAFSMLAENLDENDVVSIVTYAGSAGVVLDSVRGDQQEKIINAIYSLSAEGSTAGAEGILTAYALAEKNYDPEMNNRVILATDGDFNVGVSSVSELERLIGEKRDNGVYLTILGFGTENLKDNRMEALAKNGNGSYHYIDSVYAASKVLVNELSSNLFTIADDVKAQVEFNSAQVSSYRLIGYENRRMANRDFNDDTKDAGEVGVGSDIVLLFELEMDESGEQELKYQANEEATASDYSDELFEVRIRYKNPGESASLLITEPVKNDRLLGRNSSDFTFAASVAGFGHLLRDSSYSGSITPEKVLEMAKEGRGRDEEEYRREYIEVLEKYCAMVR